MSSSASLSSRGWNGLADAGSRQLTLIHPNKSSPTDGMIAVITADYNTGWMKKPVGCWLSDTTTGDLVGGTIADRSHNANDLAVTGTLSRTVIGPNSDLVGFSEFSSLNYAEHAYNADFDFGTGPFSISGWLKIAANSSVETILERDSATTAQRFTLTVNASGFLTFTVDDNTTVRTATSTIVVDTDQWIMFNAVYDGAGGLRIYLNGLLNDTETGSALLTMNNASAVLRIGAAVDGTSGLVNGTLPPIKIEAAALTAEEVEKKYRDEKDWFHNPATLHGTSSDVKAIAYNPKTGIVSAGTSAGRSDFQGLVRVKNTTTAVTTAIAASGSVIVEQ